MNIGHNLKTLRKAHKLTQNDIATILNTSQQHISQLEKNNRQLDIFELKQLSTHFGIPCDFLIAEDFSIYASSVDTVKFLTMYATLSPPDQKLIKQFIHRLLPS